MNNNYSVLIYIQRGFVVKNEILKQIIEQNKKYELTKTFSDVEEFKKQASKLNGTQISDFISLDIDLEERME